MAQPEVEAQIRSFEEYEEQLSELTVQVAREVVKRKNNDNHIEDYGEYYQLIEDSFYQDAPLAVIDFCEFSPSASLPEIASNSSSEKDFTQMLAHDLLTVAVENGVLSMMDGKIINGVELEREGGGTWTINEAGKSGIIPLPDGWTEIEKEHPHSGSIATSHSYFQHESGCELVIWEELRESRPYLCGEEDGSKPSYAIEVYDRVDELVEGSGFSSLRWAKSAAKLCMQIHSEP